MGSLFRHDAQRSYLVIGPSSHRLDAGPFRTFGALDRRGPREFFEEIETMAHRIRRVWSFVLAVAPISAIVLVEAAMRRWN